MIQKLLRNFSPFERVESYALLPFVVALFVTTMGFWVGWHCTKWPLLTGLIIVSLLLIIRSPRKALLLWCWYIAAFILCAYCFSYRGIDLRVYHAPVQLLLNHGWNPIFQSSVEEVTSLTNGECMVHHVLFLPHLNHYLASMISQLTGLFLADTFPSFLILFILFAVAYRFARIEWNAHYVMAFVFAAFVALPSKISIVFDSGIDYALYGYLAVGILSYLNWTRTQSCDDIFLSVSTLAFSAGMKFTGLLCSGLIILFIALRHHKSKQVRYAVIAAAIFIVVVNASPYLTAWVRYGSPLYPLHTFNHNIELVNITDDFTANSDGLKMGYGLRIIYAWFSKSLATWLGGFINGNPNFSPEFYVPGGVDGLKSWFCFLMWGSIIALLLSKRTRIVIVCLAIFALSNIAPLKYIGYSRYFTQIWLIPALAYYGLIYSPSKYISRASFALKALVPTMLFTLSLSIFIKSITLNAWDMALESARQQAIAEVVSQHATAVSQKDSCNYFLQSRMKLAGHFAAKNIAHEKKIIFDHGSCFPQWDDAVAADEFKRDFPHPEGFSHIKQFKWMKLLTNMPHPLWTNKK